MKTNLTSKTRIILGTGSYDTVKSGNTVSITGDGGNAWGYFGQSYKKLAPRLNTYLTYAHNLEKVLELKKDITKLNDYLKYKRIIEDEYISSYYDTRLKNLDIDELFYILHEKFGNDIILLCHEPINEFCHRRLVADYIELVSGIYVPEVNVDERGNVKELIPISYKNRLEKLMKK